MQEYCPLFHLCSFLTFSLLKTTALYKQRKGQHPTSPICFSVMSAEIAEVAVGFLPEVEQEVLA